MKTSLILILVIAGMSTYAQQFEYLIQYRNLGVKSVRVSANEKIQYAYFDNYITEKNSLHNNDEKRYFLRPDNQIDSVLTIVNLKIHSERTTLRYYYNENNQLSKVLSDGELNTQIVTLDSFRYNTKGLIDTILRYSNRKDYAGGSELLDTLIPYAYYAFDYDEQNMLKRMNTNQPFGVKEIKYFYDTNNRLTSTNENYGFATTGDIMMETRRLSRTKYIYFNNGLIRKRITKSYIQQPNRRPVRAKTYRHTQKYIFFSNPQ